MSSRSKYLALLLRHDPAKASLTLDKEGWCDIGQLIQNTDFTLEELEDIVAKDEKGRYSIQYWTMGGDGLPTTREPVAIRANQGHSTAAVNLSFMKAVPPASLYHGTTTAAVTSIKKQGLLPMKRHHVHLSADIETAMKVGSRRKEPLVIIEVDCAWALKDGLTFMISDNGVWLADSVPAKYLTMIIEYD